MGLHPIFSKIMTNLNSHLIKLGLHTIFFKLMSDLILNSTDNKSGVYTPVFSKLISGYPHSIDN